jgi:hypothetical protein
MAILLSLVTGILAFFTKTYFVFGFGSIVLSYWFIHKDRKTALSYLILSGVSLVTTVLIFNHFTNGLYYLFTFEMQTLWTGYSLSFLLDINIKSLMFFYLPLFALIMRALLRRTLDYRRYGVFLSHLLIGLPLSIFLSLNVGGGPYYWYTIIPVIIVIGCDLMYLEITTSNHKIIVPVLLATILIMIYSVGYKDIIKKEFVIPSSELANEWKPLQELVKKTKGRVMNSNETTILNIKAGKDLFVEGMGYKVNRDYLIGKHNYSFVNIYNEIELKKYNLIINPEVGLKNHVMKHYELYKTYMVAGQFGRGKMKINVFTPKNAVLDAINSIQ